MMYVGLGMVGEEEVMVMGREGTRAGVRAEGGLIRRARKLGRGRRESGM